MFKSAYIAVAMLLFALTPVIAASPDAPTRGEVIERVNEAVQFYRSNGREKTIAELTDMMAPSPRAWTMWTCMT